MRPSRDFAAELQAARAAQDWAAHERIWEERRCADVDRDEASLEMPPRQNIATPTKDLEDAITAEAQDWADFFEVTDPQDFEARKRVHRANARVGYYDALKGYWTGA